MSYFECKACGFTTDDASVPDCPHCSGYLSEMDEEVSALDDSRSMEELYY